MTETTAPPSPPKNKTPPSSSNAKPPVYNPHWKGYSYLLLSSLINLSATSNVPKSGSYSGSWSVAVSFGSVTFGFAFLVLFFDRTQLLVDTFHYTTACQGQLEGYVLLCVTIWWIIGVAYMTQVKGIAYYVLNVYFGAWLSLAASLYTLNHWSTKQDLLSWQELTGVSATLKSWYILWLASLVVLGTCINLVSVDVLSDGSNFGPDVPAGATGVGMALGFLSTTVSFGFILVHYRLVEFCATGGVTEFLTGVGLCVAWIVGVAVMTQEGAIGATIVGRGYSPPFWDLIRAADGVSENATDVDPSYDETMECRVLIMVPQTVAADNTTAKLNVTVPCDDLWDTTQPEERLIPGSNLYLAVWTCLAASIHLLMRWKAQQALRFAEAQEKKTRLRGDDEGEDEDDDDDFGEESSNIPRGDDEDDDLDEFIDAVNN